MAGVIIRVVVRVRRNCPAAVTEIIGAMHARNIHAIAKFDLITLLRGPRGLNLKNGD